MRRSSLPVGYIDIYKNDDLAQYHPFENNGIMLHVAEMDSASIEVRAEAGGLLLEAFNSEGYGEDVLNVLDYKKWTTTNTEKVAS